MNVEELEQLREVLGTKKGRWGAGRKVRNWIKRNGIQVAVFVLVALVLLSFCAGGK